MGKNTLFCHLGIPLAPRMALDLNQVEINKCIIE